MAKDLDELIGRLYDMLNDAFTLPLASDKCFIDKDKALALLDEIAATLPGYLKDAKRVMQEEAQILAKAKRDADTMRRNAEDTARRLVSEHEVLAAAKRKAHDLVADAEGKSKEIRKTTNAYVDDLLKRTEEAIGAARSEIINTRTEFRTAARHRTTGGD